METLRLMDLLVGNAEPYRGNLRVHEANAEVVIEIGGVTIPVERVSWKGRKLRGRRQYTLTLHGDAAELLHDPAEGPGRHGAGAGGPGEGPADDLLPRSWDGPQEPR